MPKATPVASVAVIVIAALTISSCGDTVIDDGKAEDAVQADVESQLGVKVASVECPTGVKVEAGRTFECVVTIESGDRAKAVLRILNSDADVHFIDLRPLK
jgi:hypothetical protein